MAVPVPIGQNSSLPEAEPEFDPIQLTAARLLAHTNSRGEVARKLERHLITANQAKMNPTKRRMFAMRKLRKWSRRKDFRDLVWQYSVERLDSRTPDILDGVARRGSAGRVDAAKLSLEIAGRYVSKGTDQPTQVQIIVGGVPRPIPVDVVDGELVSEED